ncbi:hypothetical protein [Dyadobacter psychrotolerans]|uniref:TerB family tellurite resistance protein n=1 Tax=Dyadobacter psychrotolerans TaxID=2541721 RepID=A0A4R5DIW6_9BACT|nr:hypothetical protein [Dyadobacter psychrotolerans]TDE10725.1 hypothetical protein E0F88_26995 [Dyadobacter psychrotolerans]
MKKLILLILLGLTSQTVSAQRSREWIRQKKTQKQYLIEQIAHFKLYYELAKNGYQTAQLGLELISDIKNREFTLHKNRFDSLLIVKPKLVSYAQATGTAKLAENTIALCNNLSVEIRSSGMFTGSQVSHINRTLNLLLSDTGSVLSDFNQEIKSGSFSISDGQRVQRIGLYHKQILTNYEFAINFTSEVRLMAQQKKQLKQITDNVRALQGLK